MTRRDILRNTAFAAAAGMTTAASGQHVHEAVQEQTATAPYKKKAFTDHEWATLRRLCDLIVPADDKSKGALDGQAPEYIDLLSSNNPVLSSMFTGGLAWLDHACQRRFSVADFVSATPGQQTELLDLIAYRKNESVELGPGIRFFDLARRMTVDAFYTSAAGIEAVGYMGNKAVSKFEIPVEAIEYAVKRSGLG
jgi:gluconate 2-dehydrogenase gamma chain